MRRHGVLLLIALGIVVSTLPAQAHTAIGTGGYYNLRWKSDLTLIWRFASNFPTTGYWRDKIAYGVGQWNNQNQPLQWSQYGDQSDFDFNSCPSTSQKDLIHWANIAYAGLVKTCVFANDHSRLWSTNMVIDSSGPNWYTGSSSPAANQTDLWSIASHEWGHMSGSVSNGDGLGHFPESDAACPEDYNRNTMCPTIPIGTNYMWDLNTHDKHTFTAAY